MTLGGLALAVGILVDDATVTIENINWHLEQGKDVETGDHRRRAADRDAGVRLDALHLHRVRADVLPRRASRASCSCRWRWRSCSRWSCSFILSRTLVPTMVNYLLRRTTHRRRTRQAADAQSAGRASSAASSARFERFRARLPRPAGVALAHRARVRRRLPGLRRCARSLLAPFLGRDFFPRSTPARSCCTCARPSARASRRPRSQFADIEKAIREIIPPRRDRDDGRQHRHAGQRHQHVLQQHRHDRPAGRRDPDRAEARTIAPTADYVRELRDELPRALPGRRRSSSCRPTSSARS